MKVQAPALDAIYDAIYEEEDARACADISARACSNVPDNFFLHVGVMSLSKLADAIANTKTTIPWLLSSLGAPGWIVSVIVPIRESGSMLPQLAIASWIRTLSVRKWCYAGGALLQALAMLCIAISALTLSGTAAGAAVLCSVVVFSLARGICSVASKDVLGKTVPKNRRGRVTGLSASVAGAGTLVVVALLWRQPPGVASYAWLMFAAGVFWLLAALLYVRIKEEAGATEGGKNGLAEAFARFALLRSDVAFRRFVIARSLLVGTALTAPFIVLLARERTDTSLAVFLLAQGSAAVISGHFWGVFADRSSRKVMLAAALAAGILGLGVFLTDRWLAALTASDWFLPGVFFVLAIVHDGVRLGRKTFLIDLGSGNKRTDYVAVSNTVIGGVLLLAGFLAGVIQQQSNIAAILFFSLTAFAAAVFAWLLPEVQQD